MDWELVKIIAMPVTLGGVSMLLRWAKRRGHRSTPIKRGVPMHVSALFKQIYEGAFYAPDPEPKQIVEPVIQLRGQRPDPDQSTPLSIWMREVNSDPTGHAHVFICGPTGAGKTWLAQVLVAARKDRILIIDPKPSRPDQLPKWGGTPYVTIDDDATFTTIDQTLRSLRRELNDRLRNLRDGILPEPLTVVVDEFPMVVDACSESAPDLLMALGRTGRELDMRVVAISQSTRVKSLGIAGEGDVRDNYTLIGVGKDHTARRWWNNVDQSVSISEVPSMLSRSRISDDRLWSFGPSARPHDATALHGVGMPSDGGRTADGRTVTIKSNGPLTAEQIVKTLLREYNITQVRTSLSGIQNEDFTRWNQESKSSSTLA